MDVSSSTSPTSVCLQIPTAPPVSVLARPDSYHNCSGQLLQSPERATLHTI